MKKKAGYGAISFPEKTMEWLCTYARVYSLTQQTLIDYHVLDISQGPEAHGIPSDRTARQ